LIALGRDYRHVDRAYAFAVFKSPRLEYDRHDESQQRRLLRDAYAGLGWETPRLLESLDDSTELYFDSISQVSVPTWSRGRVALLGDAACGATIGGMGTGTAVVAAYVLAGELATARGDHRTAFRRYEDLMRTYAPVNQRSRPGPFLAPATSWGLKTRNALLRNRFVLGTMLKATKKLTTTLSLPNYPNPGGWMRN
jgi:2-polyprenyl-6-methoxyphenol hydroxylase-like FAD-dependent oxidoreductase